MERKIILNLFYMGLISAVLGIFLTAVILHNSITESVRSSLKTEGNLIVRAYNDISSYDDLEDYALKGLRITLIDKSGSVLFESEADASKMGNHLERPEIQSAISVGYGMDKRTSDTIGTEVYYYAVELEDKNILRVSVKTSSVFSIFEKTLPVMLVVMIFLLVFSVIFSIILTRKLLSPIKKIPAGLDDPKLSDDPERVYPELVPFVKEIQKQRSEREEMRQEFTANVSHELKTPLTSISGYAEIIETGMAKGDDVIRFSAKIRTEASRMLVLISDIIKLSKLDMTDEVNLTDNIDLKEISCECAEHLSDSAEKHGIKINISGDSEIFFGNCIEIYELIYNLVDNAIKYNRENGNVNIILCGKRLIVDDTGIGISDSDKERMFERFYRADKSRSRATGGTGLGLSIVKHIAEHHNAKITVKSNLNVGTRITVDF